MLKRILEFIEEKINNAGIFIGNIFEKIAMIMYNIIQ